MSVAAIAPENRSNNAPHCDATSFRLRKSTEKKAVNRVLVWYVTWKMGISRFAVATNIRLPWIVNATAGSEHLSVLKVGSSACMKLLRLLKPPNDVAASSVHTGSFSASVANTATEAQ